jgi:hypothetical protein
MQRANINDRGSIERIYPRAVFEREAQANTRAKASVLYGVRIHSTPDESGAFQLIRASHHVGEDERQAASLFICPFAQEPPFAERGNDYGAVEPRPATGVGVHGDYDAFIDKIIETARTARLDAAPGRDDARLQGLRQ